MSNFISDFLVGKFHMPPANYYTLIKVPLG